MAARPYIHRRTKIVFIVLFCAIIASVWFVIVSNHRVLEQQHIENIENELLPERFNTTNKLFNLSDFKYVISNNVCEENEETEKLEVIIIITSYAGDVETRSAIRQAYPSSFLRKQGMRRIFLLALINENKNYNHVSQDAILDENRRFKDILQGNFYEDYKNLTYKHTMGLAWAGIFCSKAKYVFKMDHDIAVNFFKIKELYSLLPNNNFFLAGYVLDHMKPKREPRNKWYVSYNEYEPDAYPDFLSGWFYITTPLVARLLYKTSFTDQYFWIDDLLLTGIFVKKLNIPLIDMKKYYTSHTEHIECCVSTKTVNCELFIGPTSGNNKLLIEFGQHSEYCFYNICENRKIGKTVKETCVAKWKNELFGKGRSEINQVQL